MKRRKKETGYIQTEWGIYLRAFAVCKLFKITKKELHKSLIACGGLVYANPTTKYGRAIHIKKFYPWNNSSHYEYIFLLSDLKAQKEFTRDIGAEYVVQVSKQNNKSGRRR